MGAPNPWFEGSPPLSSSEILKEGEHPLDLIREFILNWPGEETVKFDFETRHNRLIQIIAGYPEIDVGRYPLDWPLSKKANDALRLTRYLDSIKSPDGKTSLRSVLLNQSTRVKQFETEKELIPIIRNRPGIRFPFGIHLIDELGIESIDSPA